MITTTRKEKKENGKRWRQTRKDTRKTRNKFKSHPPPRPLLPPHSYSSDTFLPIFVLFPLPHHLNPPALLDYLLLLFFCFLEVLPCKMPKLNYRKSFPIGVLVRKEVQTDTDQIGSYQEEATRLVPSITRENKNKTKNRRK
jgi:hypothetical protein